MSDRQSSAVVLGSSMAGLLAARALSAHFKRVTIVERDSLPLGAEIRKGVPQSAHAHGLLASGYRVMDSYFPGMMEQLEAQGATRGDVVGDFLWFQYGRWKLRHDAGLLGITVSRPGLEAAIRDRVRALPNVEVLDHTDVVKPVFDAPAGRVTSVIVRPRGGAEQTLTADLIVDASGRGSQSPAWLAEWGFGQPETVVVKINVGYATRTFERKPGDFFNSMGGIVAGTPPRDTRYSAVLAAEGNRWVVTLVGSVGDHPPADEAGWNAFAGSLPSPVVYDLVTTARPLTDIVAFKFPANLRRVYEKMPRFPERYVVIGDAICSFNPLYGQGMSVASTEAKALDECVAAGLDGIGKRFFARASKIVDIPWLIATGEDLRYPQVEGKRAPGSSIVNRYLERVHAAASDDRFVCRKFFDVLNLLAGPESLMAPAVARRVLFRRVPSGAGTPWGTVREPPPSAAV